jgi:4-phospho-D-threonate 3-dehydrogenase / 4-phospho-D-erythronate 3-dehydrogenase
LNRRSVSKPRTVHPKPSVIGITLGDPAGIGPEIVIKALRSKTFPKAVLPVVFGDRPVLEQIRSRLGVPFAFREISDRSGLAGPGRPVRLVSTGVIGSPVRFGRVDALCGRSAHVSVAHAVDWAMRGWIDGIATAPLQKEALRLGGCRELDHTEILKTLTGASEETTLFTTGNLRIFFLTRHIPVSAVPAAVTGERLLAAIPACLKFLRQLGLRNPKLAVAALNPHGGEGGMFGTEESDTIRPAVEAARDRGLSVAGPIPADSVFHLANQGAFDAVLSLYHDQGHIAAKTLDFRRTVSLTMGLPFLRTSVDHGTAFDIAGRGVADETGMVEAVIVAAAHSKRVRKAQRKDAA